MRGRLDRPGPRINFRIQCSSSFDGQRQPPRERVPEDLDQDDTGQGQHHGRRDRHPQQPHHPAMAGGRGKAGLHSGGIGWVLDRVHRGSKGRQDAGKASFYPQSQDFAAWTRAMSVTETGRREAPRRFKWSRSRMREDVLGLPAAEIELGPGRQEVETGLRQFVAAFARQHRVEPLAQTMQMQHVGRGIGELRLAEA